MVVSKIIQNNLNHISSTVTELDGIGVLTEELQSL